MTRETQSHSSRSDSRIVYMRSTIHEGIIETLETKTTNLIYCSKHDACWLEFTGQLRVPLPEKEYLMTRRTRGVRRVMTDEVIRVVSSGHRI